MFPYGPVFRLMIKLAELELAVHKMMKPIFYFFMGDTAPTSAAHKRALENPNGLGIARIGPPIVGIKLVHFLPTQLPPLQVRELFQRIFELKNTNSRIMYDICDLTESSFFLGMPDKEAKPLRNKMMPFLNVRHYKEQLPFTLSQLIKQLKNNEDISLFKNLIVKNAVFDFFARCFIGFESVKSLHKTLDAIKLATYYCIFPKWIFSLHPAFRKKKSEIDCSIKFFLREELKRLNEKKEMTHFQKIIVSKLSSHQQLSQLTASEMEKLIREREVRLCVTGLIAFDNIYHAINSGLNNLYSHPRFVKKISYECTLAGNDDEYLSDKNKSPYLHSFFLETLRFSAPMSILRYTSSTIRFGNIVIPRRSYMCFDLPAVLKSLWGSESYPTHMFYPERFLDERGMLQPHATLHEEMLVPFGVGLRRCPADKLSLYVFKYFILYFVKMVKNYTDTSEIELNRAPAMKVSASQRGLFAKEATLIESSLGMRQVDRTIKK